MLSQTWTKCVCISVHRKSRPRGEPALPEVFTQPLHNLDWGVLLLFSCAGSLCRADVTECGVQCGTLLRGWLSKVTWRKWLQIENSRRNENDSQGHTHLFFWRFFDSHPLCCCGGCGCGGFRVQRSRRARETRWLAQESLWDVAAEHKPSFSIAKIFILMTFDK